MDKKVYEFISEQSNDPIVEWKTCKVSKQEFPIFQSDLDFYDKISPVIGGQKYIIPTPTLCPEERQRRRWIFRNERKLYKRKCNATNENIISIYSPDTPYKVYNSAFWRSDKWDPLQYGRDFDFSKTFSEQFDALVKDVPLVALRNRESENSDYTHCCYGNKNCYMIFNTDHSEESFHSYISDDLKHCIDCTYVFGGQQCYECTDCNSVYQCMRCKRCKQCSDCKFCINCENCNFCFGCVNLVNAQYCFFNEQLTKETYNKKIDEGGNIDTKKLSDIQQQAEDLVIQLSVRGTKLITTEQCFGHLVYNSKNAVSCFDCFDDLEACKYGIYGEKNKNVQDAYAFVGVENSYEVMSGVGLYNSCFIDWINNGPHNSFYCKLCVNGCEFCFGCVGLKKKQYCIFNKQYTKEQYEELVPKIIEHMQQTGERGEFFDSSFSPFGYNETIAQEYFPIAKNEALARGYKRQDKNYDPTIPDGVETLAGDNIPQDITQVQDDILKKIFICEVSGRPFRIIQKELDFYRKHILPLPRKHPDIRHAKRIQSRPERTLHIRNCDNCKIEMLSVYPASYTGKVFCEKCYDKEIY